MKRISTLFSLFLMVGMSACSHQEKLVEPEPTSEIIIPSVSLSATSLSLIIGESERLFATITPSEVADKGCVWTASDANIATVDSSGIVTAISVGGARITAALVSYPAISVVCAVTVYGPADLAYLAPNAGSLDPVFDPNTTDYSVDVDYSVSSVTITAGAASAGANIAYSPAPQASLVVGENKFAVTVTAQDMVTEKKYTVTVNRSLSYLSPNIGRLNHVPAGTFQRDDKVANTSAISADFRMGAAEITRAQFVAVTGLADPSASNYSSGTGDPVQQVSWYHAILFCNMLSIREGLVPVYAIDGGTDPSKWGSPPVESDAAWNAVTADWSASGYRLPTLMEWMWAAMGATSGYGYTGGIYTTGYTKAFAGSTGSNAIGDYAWYETNSGRKTHPAGDGAKLVNELGLYGMSGNVWEWCWDWSAISPAGPDMDYRGPASGISKYWRGGSWVYGESYCVLTQKIGTLPNFINADLGFRVVRL